MKKILLIITFFVIFSIAQSWYAAERWYIENLLELPTGPEAFDINIQTLPAFTFNNIQTQNIFNSYKEVSVILKNELLSQYENETISQYMMRDLIRSYNLFIYHTSRMFYYISLKDENPGLKDAIYPISKNYSLSRVHYNKIKNIINNNRSTIDNNRSTTSTNSNIIDTNRSTTSTNRNSINNNSYRY